MLTGTGTGTAMHPPLGSGVMPSVQSQIPSGFTPIPGPQSCPHAICTNRARATK
ncbi:hypothetical protein B484DRAFT_459457 [Ochromonadaceae sp. CCMP2298]|nr:hypothetical protein B484DRAFT_459457 [Ochromonadaceae sp. CCMP2298]